MKTILPILLISLLIIGISCKKEEPISLTQDYNLELGYTVAFNQDELQIHFDEVLQDSRCPIPLLCDLPGSVRVRIIISEKQIERDFEFYTEDIFPSQPAHMDTLLTTSFGDYLFELKEVLPYPVLTNSAPEEYNISFSLTEVE